MPTGDASGDARGRDAYGVLVAVERHTAGTDLLDFGAQARGGRRVECGQRGFGVVSAASAALPLAVPASGNRPPTADTARSRCVDSTWSMNHIC